MKKAAVVLAVVGMLALTGCNDPMQEAHQRQMKLMDACLRDGGESYYKASGGVWVTSSLETGMSSKAARETHGWRREITF